MLCPVQQLQVSPAAAHHTRAWVGEAFPIVPMQLQAGAPRLPQLQKVQVSAAIPSQLHSRGNTHDLSAGPRKTQGRRENTPKPTDPVMEGPGLTVAPRAHIGTQAPPGASSVLSPGLSLQHSI